MPAGTLSRTAQRSAYSPDLRIARLEEDADDFDAQLARIDARLSKIMATCVSILVALVTASILLAVNLAVGA